MTRRMTASVCARTLSISTQGRGFSGRCGRSGWMSRTAKRLRTVPADLTLDATCLDPAEVQQRITEFLAERDREPLWPRPAPLHASFSYSMLPTYERCPLAFRFRYLDARSEDFLAESTMLGQALHEVLAWLHEPGRAEGLATLDEVLAAFQRVPGKPCRRCSYYFSCPAHLGEPSPGFRVT
jgi:hypothetical protein